MSSRSGQIDLGLDPPLRASSGALPEHGLAARLFPSLGAVSLAGFFAVALIGTLLVGVLGDVDVLLAPDAGISAQPKPNGTSIAKGDAVNLSDDGAGKSDRSLPSDATVSKMTVIAVNTTIRQGERDLINVRPYAYVRSNLAEIADAKYADLIPSYDPLAMYPETQIADTNGGAILDTIFQPRFDTEVAISVIDFPGQSDHEASLALDESEVRQALQTLFATGSNIADPNTGRGDTGPLGYVRKDPQSDPGVRITAANISFVGKQSAGESENFSEKFIIVNAPKTLNSALENLDLARFDIMEVVRAFGAVFGIHTVGPEHVLHITFSTSGYGGLEARRLERVSLYLNHNHSASVARADDGVFVQARAPSQQLDPGALAASASEPRETTGMTLYQSLYQTGFEAGMDADVIDHLLKIFSFEVDYNAPVRAGLGMEAFFGLEDPDSGAPAEIYYAALKLGEKTHRFYRFQPDAGGPVDYYDDSGVSAKKFLIRRPIIGGRYTSGFGMRRHPILRVKKMHNGVDWAARRGTPILAAGDGIVAEARWRSGYGRRVEIRHDNGYVTTYSHMTRIAKTVKPGIRVAQGQTIGYVGSTGLSTGPHLHYEILVDGRYVDPMKINLPQGRELNEMELAQFENERRRLDRLLQRAQNQSSGAAAEPS